MPADFRRYERRFRQPAGPVTVAPGPSVASTGWIPFYSDLELIRNSPIATYPLGRSPIFTPTALTALFWSGNQTEIPNANPAAAAFASRTDFLALVNSKNFRSVMALDDVQIEWDEDGPVSVKLAHLERVGYTAIRVPGLPVHFDMGRGASLPPRAEVENDAVVVRQTIRFKLGRIEEWGCWVLTGRRAPSAGMETKCTFHREGSVHVEFAGTGVPSQSYYVNWVRIGLHDMTSESVDHGVLRAFLEAGDCRDAPARTLWRSGQW